MKKKIHLLIFCVLLVAGCRSSRKPQIDTRVLKADSTELAIMGLKGLKIGESIDLKELTGVKITRISATTILKEEVVKKNSERAPFIQVINNKKAGQTFVKDVGNTEVKEKIKYKKAGNVNNKKADLSTGKTDNRIGKWKFKVESYWWIIVVIGVAIVIYKNRKKLLGLVKPI